MCEADAYVLIIVYLFTMALFHSLFLSVLQCNMFLCSFHEIEVFTAFVCMQEKERESESKHNTHTQPDLFTTTFVVLWS